MTHTTNMSPRAMLLKSMLAAALFGVGSPLFCDAALYGRPAAQLPAEKATQVKKKAAESEAKNEDSTTEIQLPGIVQPRQNGGFLTIEVVDGKLKIGFYDAKKKSVTADVPRASAHWKTNRKLVIDRTVLSPDGDGTALVGAKFVKPPYVFILYINLLNEDGTAKESYIVHMNS